MKGLLLNGSPHADGCTAAALREVASTLECEGVETEILHVVGQPIRGCTACRRCKEAPGRCVFDDDLVNRVLEKMEHADGLVIGSPVYYASANGALISLLDRVFYAGSCFRCKPACVAASSRRTSPPTTTGSRPRDSWQDCWTARATIPCSLLRMWMNLCPRL